MPDVDVIVIGSGAGGLTAALALAQAGLKVLVLEQHYLPGGWCHSFTLGGYRFSPGVHYLGELGPGGRARWLYEGLGLGADLTFYELNPQGFDHIHLGADRFDIPAGRDALAARLASRFPNERAGTEAYLSTVGRIHAELDDMLDEEARGVLQSLSRARTVLRWAFSTGRSLIESHVRHPRLRALLAAQAGDHGLPPSLVSAPVHAAVVGHYFGGGFYPKGGGAALPRAFIRALRRAGGDIRARTEVERILLEKGRAIGVRLSDGTEIRSRFVVSNADPTVTFEHLIGREHVGFRLRRKLARTRYSVSALSLFLAVDADLRARGLDSGNTWYYESPDVEGIYRLALMPESIRLPEVPGFFMTASSLKDPSKDYGGHHTIEAFTLVSYDAFKAWAHTCYGERPADYAALKTDLKRRFLSALSRVVPEIDRHVIFCELGTPLTNVHYLAASFGNLYGTAKTRFQVGPWGFGINTPIEGLKLCGASTLGHGVLGASISGLRAAQSILRCRLGELVRASGAPITILQAEPS